MEMINPDELIDYTNEGWIIPIEFGGARCYASINSEMVYEDGLDPTGCYFVYLLHYRHGGCSFKMEPSGEGKWDTVGQPDFIESEIIHKIIDAIESHNE